MQVYLKATIDLMLNSGPEVQEEVQSIIKNTENKVKQLENGLIYLIIKEDE